MGSCAVTKTKHSHEKSMNAVELCSWHKENRSAFQDTINLDGIYYVLEYKPTQVQIARQVVNEQATITEAKEMLTSVEGLYFTLTLFSNESNVDIFDFRRTESNTRENRIMYYSFGLKKDIYFHATEGDSLNPVSFSLEKGFNSTPSAKFNLATNYTLKQLKTLSIVDMEMGKKRIDFNLSSIKKLQIPTLSL
jgi:hypothetical protein